MPNSLDRLYRVARAARLVLAARRDRRRDQPLVQPDRRGRDSAAAAHARLPAASSSSSSAPRDRRPGPRARPAREPRGARRRRSRGRSADPPRGARNASRSRRLTRLRSHRSAHLPRDRYSKSRSIGVAAARERVQDQMAVAVRAAAAVDPLELGAARQPARARPARPGTRGRLGHRLDGEALAALGAAVLEHPPTCARAHARAEPVDAGALAFLGLIRALHGLTERSDGGGGGKS